MSENALDHKMLDGGYSPVDDKTVYITFDDGPTYVITDKILDVLKKKNVKATFFVVGKEIEGREKVLKRIYDEGHSIGVHTYSHNFRKIYRNEDIFVDEMCRTSKLVHDITGFAPSALRYPGGSSSHLSNNVLNRLHSNGFRVYDWNVSIGDGINSNLSSLKLLENSKACKGGCYRRIILMHSNSNNINTVKALPQIIDYYKAAGFKFAPITYDTPEYYYRIKDNLNLNKAR
jgi:peptidoglycan-N-acetylglucosamine deacetylase